MRDVLDAVLLERPMATPALFVEKGFDRVFRKHGGFLTYRGVEFALVRADAQKVLQLVGFLDRVDEKLVRQAEQAVCHQNTDL